MITLAALFLQHPIPLQMPFSADEPVPRYAVQVDDVISRHSVWVIIMLRRKDVLTTGQVAKICNVAPRTVSKWFDSGQLRGYKIPGSKDRRIPVDQLLCFMHAHGMPTDELKLGPDRILVIDNDVVFATTLKKVLEGEGFDVIVADAAFEAGALVQRAKPNFVLMDVDLPDIDPKAVSRFFRSSSELQSTLLIGMGLDLDHSKGELLLQQGLQGWLNKPFRVTELLELLEPAADLVESNT